MKTLLAIFCLVPFLSQARWLTKKEVSEALNYENAVYYISADGTYVEEIEREIEVINEVGRNNNTVETITYNSDTTKLTIIEAKTINKDKTYPVPEDKIVLKDLKNSSQGFDSSKAISIGYSNVNIGSKVYVKYQREVFSPSVNGLFSALYSFGDRMLERKGHAKFISEVPLYTYEKDPHDIYSVKESMEEKNFVVEVTLNKEALFVITEEDSSYKSDKDQNFFQISTFDGWKNIHAEYMAGYEEVIGKKLPKDFSGIVKEAKGIKNEVDRINFVTSKLAKKITYLGDWRTKKGRLIPQDFTEIIKTNTGDCKDYSALTVAILRKTGMKAWPAFTTRASYYDYSRPLDIKLPEFHVFNHAIVYTETKDGPLWIDPTNFVSDAKSVNPDIANQNALVLKDKMTALQRTDQLKIKDNSTTLHRIVDVSDQGNVDVKGRLILKNKAAFPFTGIGNKFPKNRLDYLIVNAVAKNEVPIWWEVENIDLKSTVSKDLNIGFKYKGALDYTSTTAGSAIKAPSYGYATALNFDASKTVGDFIIGKEGTYTSHYMFNNIKIVGNSDKLGCWIHSKWLDVSRTIDYENNNLYITDEIVTKKQIATNKEMKTLEFSTFQKNVMKCLGNVSIVIEKNTPSRGIASVGNMNIDKKQLTNDDAFQLLEFWDGDQLELIIARDIFKRTIHELDSQVGLAIVSRLLGYVKGDEFIPSYVEKSKSYIEKVLLQKPDHPRAMREMANIYRAEGNSEKAREIYEELLNYKEFAGSAYYYLGRLMFNEKNFKKANELFTYSDQNLPEGHPLRVSLYSKHAESFGRMEMKKECFELYDKALELDPNRAWTYHNYAIYIDWLGDDPKLAIEYAKKALELKSFDAAKANIGKYYIRHADKLDGVGNWGEAKKNYELALEFRPEDINASFGMIKVMYSESIEKKDDSFWPTIKKSLKTILARAPEYKPAIKFKEDFDNKLNPKKKKRNIE